VTPIVESQSGCRPTNPHRMTEPPQPDDGEIGDYGPDHWEALYRQGRMPWDAGGIPEDFARWLAGGGPGGRALIPGCGSGYEAVRLAAAGYEVLAIDFSRAAVTRARRINEGSGARVELADFFSLAEQGFDLIYERAFMCALPPTKRADWAFRCAELLAPGGWLTGLFFIDAGVSEGPPFGIDQEALLALLDPAFELHSDSESLGSLPVFVGRERWQAWRRRERAAT